MANADNITISPTRRHAGRPRKWTAAAIRKATLLPKPEGAREALHDYLGERQARGPLDVVERELLRSIAERADILDTDTAPGGNYTRYWLLVAVSQHDLDLLAHFEAERAEMEGDDDREEEFGEAEPDADGEPDDEPEEDDPNGSDGDDEPTVGYAESFQTMGLSGDEPNPLLVEQQEGFRARTGHTGPWTADDWKRFHDHMIANGMAGPADGQKGYQGPLGNFQRL